MELIIFHKIQTGGVYTGVRGVFGAGQLPDAPDREEQKAITSQSVLFGNWVEGAKLSYKIVYENDPAIYPRQGRAATLTIVGTEKIKTPLGTFETWKVQSEMNGPTVPNQITGTYWYAPQLGTYVRAHEVLSSNDPEQGGEYDITLTSTNIPLGTPEITP